MEWDEKSSDEMSWDEVQVWSVECGVWRVQCEVWGKCLHCTGVARRSCSYVLGHNTTTASHSFAQSTHAQPWLEHGACKVLSRSTGKWFMEACVTYEKRWDEKRWAGLRWEELRWDEVWSVKCEECSEKCGAWRVQFEEWSVKCGLWSLKCEVPSVQS